MKKLLIVSGCSYSDPNFTSPFHPEMSCDWPKWPELLADKMGMDCLNISRCGAGQEFIYSNLADRLQSIDPKQIGLVIAAWSTAPRRDYSVKNYWTNDMFDSRGDIEYWIKRSLRYYYSFQNMCETLKIPYRQFQMIHLFKGYIWQQLVTARTKNMPDGLLKQIPILNAKHQLTNDEINWKERIENTYLKIIHNSPYFNKINDNFIGWPTDTKYNGYSVAEYKLNNKTDRISELDLHPNASGQTILAEFLYEKIINS